MFSVSAHSQYPPYYYYVNAMYIYFTSTVLPLFTKESDRLWYLHPTDLESIDRYIPSVYFLVSSCVAGDFGNIHLTDTITPRLRTILCSSLSDT